MSDHYSGLRAATDPVVDITDMYAFTSPQRTGSLVLVLDVFPFARPGVSFSDAVDYRFRLRPVQVASNGESTKFAVGTEEYEVVFRFSAPAERDGGPHVQEGSCSVSTGPSVSVTVNDERGGEAPGVRAFAGLRLDPFFFDGARMVETIRTRKLSFAEKGRSTVFEHNVLSVIVELDVGTALGSGAGPMFAVVGETTRTGPISIRLERYGRPEIKNILLAPNDFDQVNRAIEIRDLYNSEDAFRLQSPYVSAYRARLNGNLAFYDGLDGKTDWPLDPDGIHPLTDLLLADFMVVDTSKPFAEDSYFEIERALLRGTAHTSCGGRTLNDDSIDTFLTVLVTGGDGPRISDGIDQATVPASDKFPYLVAPNPDPPQLTLPGTPVKA